MSNGQQHAQPRRGGDLPSTNYENLRSEARLERMIQHLVDRLPLGGGGDSKGHQALNITTIAAVVAFLVMSGGLIKVYLEPLSQAVIDIRDRVTRIEMSNVDREDLTDLRMALTGALSRIYELETKGTRIGQEAKESVAENRRRIETLEALMRSIRIDQIERRQQQTMPEDEGPRGR